MPAALRTRSFPLHFLRYHIDYCSGGQPLIPSSKDWIAPAMTMCSLFLISSEAYWSAFPFPPRVSRCTAARLLGRSGDCFSSRQRRALVRARSAAPPRWRFAGCSSSLAGELEGEPVLCHRRGDDREVALHLLRGVLLCEPVLLNRCHDDRQVPLHLLRGVLQPTGFRIQAANVRIVGSLVTSSARSSSEACSSASPFCWTAARTIRLLDFISSGACSSASPFGCVTAAVTIGRLPFMSSEACSSASPFWVTAAVTIASLVFISSEACSSASPVCCMTFMTSVTTSSLSCIPLEAYRCACQFCCTAAVTIGRLFFISSGATASAFPCCLTAVRTIANVHFNWICYFNVHFLNTFDNFKCTFLY